MTNSLPRHPFGTTGHESSRVICGGAVLMSDNPRVNERVLALLLDYGVNHIDVAASYGKAEEAVGRWMAEHRSRFFLASKTDQRSYAGAREQIQRSLERLRCDHLDLIQFHNLTQRADHEQAFSDDGCLRAALEARDEGLVRFVGVTGHGTHAPRMHLRSLERFAFDSVLFPYNFPLLAQPDYCRDVEALLGTCAERGVAVQTIKAVARRRWANGASPTRRCWYEPIEEPAAFERAVHFVLGRTPLFLNASSDLVILERTLAVAARSNDYSAPPSDEAMDEALTLVEAQPLFVPGLDDVGPAQARRPADT
ncbi:MAG: aldo/keto reductase [Myxococcota bacterium]|nr:aldo/keto reductase [Myxococcota bacterium]